MCVLKKDDIFIDWSLWSAVESIILSKPWFECGLSSNQIRTNDVCDVVLLVVVPQAYTIISLVWPILSHCSHSGGSPVIWRFRWVAVKRISSILSPPWFTLNITLVLETLWAWPSCPDHEAYVRLKDVTSSNSCASDVSCRRWFEKVNVFPLESSQINYAYVRSILWFGDLQPSFHMYP